MNLVYIHTHDTGRWIEPYGYPVRTPNLMKLAGEGVTFRQGFCAAPTCSPSRAALLTGMAAHSCGMLGLAHRGFSLKDSRLHVSHLLGRHGFETVLCGIQHEAARAEDLHYQRIISADRIEMDRFREYDGADWKAYDLANTAAAVEYLKTAAGPFFLSMGLFNTHRPFPPADDPSAADRMQPPHTVRDTQESRRDMLEYQASASVMDECIGRLLEAIRQAGREDDTIVVFSTDHGIAFPFMKCSLTDDGIGVALIMKYPVNPARGRVLDAMVSQLDLLPTLFELLGLPRDEQFQGVSLVPLLDGRAASVREELFAEVSYHAAYEPLRCVRTRRWKYIRRFDPEHTRPVPANSDDCPAKDLLVRSGWLDADLPREELFDLDLDPRERVNLAGEAGSRAIRDRLAAQLEQWMRETGDPLLTGPVPMPRGAVVNRRDCVSPSIPDYEFG